jgi:hypothetical protein
MKDAILSALSIFTFHVVIHATKYIILNDYYSLYSSESYRFMYGLFNDRIDIAMDNGWDSILGRSKIFTSPQRPDRPRGSTQHSPMGTRGLFPWG